ncbi:pseudouridine-5'-phosphatase-like [Prorops nasuta]|uniref:pseudouridine-5'-phosphatase-like n=1 Tax=Prorops nasuta TaxID=863751 RepID=UPI0034CEABD2
MAQQFQNVTHCIFDMDGLLLDTETIYSEIYNTITQRYGKTYTWEHKVKVMGFQSQESTKAIIEMLNLPITPAEFDQQLQVLFKMKFSLSNLMPGAERLLKHLKSNNVPIALATSSSKPSYDLKTERWKHIFSLLEPKVYGSSDPEVLKGKPAPDIFIVCAKRFPDKPHPSKCLVFEDSPNGIEAALSAGMQAVMVPDPGLPKSLIPGRTTLVLNSLEEFKPELFGLVPYK